jgi:hypothetical protein
LILEQVSKKRGFLNKIHVFYRFLSGSCSETEVSEQLYCIQIKAGVLGKLFYNPVPPVPAYENQIIVYMDLREKGGWFWPWLPEERGGSYLLLFGGDTNQYTAKGDIYFGNTRYGGELIGLVR